MMETAGYFPDPASPPLFPAVGSSARGSVLRRQTKQPTPMFTDTHRRLQMLAQDVELMKARAMRVDANQQAAINQSRKALLDDKVERARLAQKFVHDMEAYMDGKCNRVMKDVQDQHAQHHADDSLQQLPLNNMSDDVERLWESLREVANAMNNMVQDTLEPELQVTDPLKSIPPDHPMYSFRGSIYSQFLPEFLEGGGGGTDSAEDEGS